MVATLQLLTRGGDIGLDMYLHAEKYIPRWDHSSDEERATAEGVLEAAGLTEAQIENAGVTVQATVMYWRKANQIHRWFVQNVQAGVDDCGDHYVSTEQLKELRELCAYVLTFLELRAGEVVVSQSLKEGQWVDDTAPGQVVTDADVAKELLPSEAGFFFGNTEYNEWYVEDLERTVKGLDRVLALDHGGGFSYQSSW